MRRSWPLPFGAGLLVAAVLAAWPASAAEMTVATTVNNTWSPTDIQIQPGDTVTWTNPAEGYHNVCVALNNKTARECTPVSNEFRNGEPIVDWGSNPTNSHTFYFEGVYHFMCEVHGGSGMVGSVTVGNPAPPAPPPSSVPETETTPTTPTQTVVTRTVATPAPKKKTPPRFTGKLRRKPNKKRLLIDMGSSKAAKMKTNVFIRKGKKFKKIGSASSKVKKGRNLVKLSPKASRGMKKGAYRLKLQLVDSGGLKSKAKTLNFKLKG